MAAATALAGAVFDTYSDERAFSEGDRQKLLERLAARLLAGAFAQIEIEPDDLEVIVLLRARDLLHPKRAALRVVHTVCMGAPHEYPTVIHEGRTVANANGSDPIWECYHDAAPSELSSVAVAPRSRLPSGYQLRLRSGSALSIWAAPLRNGNSEVVGVLALQAYATFSAREPHAHVFLPGVELAAITLGGLIASDY